MAIIRPKLIQLPIHWELATWSDFVHVDQNGNEQINFMMPYLYVDEDGKHYLSRLQPKTNIILLKEYLEEERVYRISKESMMDNTPPVRFERKDGGH